MTHIGTTQPPENQKILYLFILKLHQAKPIGPVFCNQMFVYGSDSLAHTQTHARAHTHTLCTMHRVSTWRSVEHRFDEGNGKNA